MMEMLLVRILAYLAVKFVVFRLEDTRSFLRSIYPRSNVSPVRLESYLYHVDIVSREDFYDPTTRVRHGRFYQRIGGFPIQCGRVSHVPYPRPIEISAGGSESAFDFQGAWEQNQALNKTLLGARGYEVLIGVAPAETLWRIIDAEALSEGTTLYTLKSASSFGLLPVLKSESPEIKATYANAVDVAQKLGPASIADACREAARVVLANKFNSNKNLGKLIEEVEAKFPTGENIAVLSAAKIINRLHPRGKSVEQEKQLKRGVTLRPIIDDDALLVVRLFGFILIETGFAIP
jgi:hypothetical protein